MLLFNTHSIDLQLVRLATELKTSKAILQKGKNTSYKFLKAKTLLALDQNI